MAFELTKEYVEKLALAAENRDTETVRTDLSELFAADISVVLKELDGPQAHYVLTQLDTEKGAEVLAEYEPDDRRELLRYFDSGEIARYVNILDSDDAVDLLKEQPIRIREEVIALVEDREQARFILDLLPYEPDTAGGLMQKELVRINVRQTVTECVEEIRRQAQDVEKVYTVYVIDDDETLLGIVSLKDIILAKRGSRIEQVYNQDVIYASTYDPAENVAELMRRYDLDALPVVNVQKRLLGQITIDDVVDVITEQAQEDIAAITGVSEEVEEDDSVWKITRSRLPWLGIGMIGSLMAAKFLGIFEHDLLLMVPALALFIPIIGSTGGNVGIQSSSFMVQILSDKSGISGGELWPRMLKILSVSVLKGLLIAVFVFLVTFLLLAHPLKLAMVVSISLLGVVLLSSFTGTVTPILLDRFGVNPSVASGPFITTANDFLGYSVYFGIADLLYHL
ncbi:magnesium transporter [Siphonobacter aquaeclarae]|jgi:magnesium transporter|uniref:Magnesium transporter MgtE n=1 Tax=Siphonobacter aquaeclarae TaxID=563176 RepID=A0A1G9L7E9_9BACT|nr:magnesium transporter [Siphonobacter aquaeclarae]MBO9637490.1 magnesium transporter [Siphonobacter aquaeclarae]SDL57861.1 magnesium transporter [Siphonobacter aquaeclarae]